MNNCKNIDVVILCGGLGTRLRSTLSDIPKVLAPVDGRPFLEYVVEHTASFGFRRFIFCSGYKADMVKRHFTGYGNLEIVFSEEEMPLGTGGALRLAAKNLRSDSVLVTNGDSICPLDYASLLEFHDKNDGVLSVALVGAGHRTDGGFVEVGEGNKIKAFKEKDRSCNAEYINSGVYLFDRWSIDSIPEGIRCSLEMDIIPGLIKKGVYAFIADNELYDIGTPERLENFRTLKKGEGAWSKMQKYT